MSTSARPLPVNTVAASRRALRSECLLLFGVERLPRLLTPEDRVTVAEQCTTAGLIDGGYRSEPGQCLLAADLGQALGVSVWLQAISKAAP
jgi:hypothetical protein